MNPVKEILLKESLTAKENEEIPATIRSRRIFDSDSTAMVKQRAFDGVEYPSDMHSNMERQIHQASSPQERMRAGETTRREKVSVHMENPGQDDIDVRTEAMHFSESGVESANFLIPTTLDIISEPTEHAADEVTKQGIPTALESHARAEMEEHVTPKADIDYVEGAFQRTPVSSTTTELQLKMDVPFPRTIHILGTGPTGKFIAHSLAGVAHPPPVTLLIHRPLLMQQWHEEGRSISILRDGNIVTKSDFNIESSANFQRTSPHQGYAAFVQGRNHPTELSDTVIDHLIVTTESYTTISALSAIKNRLRYSSTICFIQNGLGIVDRVNSLVFPEPASRPSYMLGNISHDLQSTERKFTIVEKCAGTTSLTMIPRAFGMRGPKPDPGKAGPLVRMIDFGWTPSSKYLMRTFSRTPELGARGLTRESFYKLQLEHLAINSVIGPLSVIYDCSNDQLLYNYHASRTMKLLLHEISLILRELPEVSRIAEIDGHFSAQRLERVILSVIGKTGKNLSSMLKAVRAGQKTDIDFYNGYLLSRATELGIDCPCIDMIVSMVKGKQAMKSRQRNSYIPFSHEY